MLGCELIILHLGTFSLTAVGDLNKLVIIEVGMTNFLSYSPLTIVTII